MLPTTTKDYRFTVENSLLEIDGEWMTIDAAKERFPRERKYIDWFVDFYQIG